MTSSVQDVAGGGREELHVLVDRGASLADIKAHCDRLDAQTRLDQMRKMGRKQQIKLWELAKGKSEAKLETFADKTETTIIYEGKNLLPVISQFQKRFYKYGDGHVVGYNHNRPLIAAVGGPGYFITTQEADGELLFDYRKVPDVAPPGWPAVAENKGLIAGPVYGGMLDYLRSVARDLYVGAAFKNGKSRNEWFMLSRGV